MTTNHERSSVDEASATNRKFRRGVQRARSFAERPLTYAEKLLAVHAKDPIGYLRRQDLTVELCPGRVAMPDSAALLAILQFMLAGRDRVAIPSTVHCDHLIAAEEGAMADLVRARSEHTEVYEFLEASCRRFGLGLWLPGSGIIHQVILEQYAYPGLMLFGSDSHTPTAGGLGSLGIGGGGAVAVDLMCGRPLQIPRPSLIGVYLYGKLSGWVTPKDVVLEVCRQLTVKGGAGAIIEYFGPGVAGIDTTGRATICNMGAETGATSSVFPFDDLGIQYLCATGREDVGEVFAAFDEYEADREVVDAPERYFDQVIEIDLTCLSPRIAGPARPDRSSVVGETKSAAPIELSQALIGSCTNSSYTDLKRAGEVARQAAKSGLRVKVPLLVAPGSERIRRTLERDGVLDDLVAIGGKVLANACGPCIGQWIRPSEDRAAPNSIVTSFNRNFPRRNDGSAVTQAFVASPEIVVALALAGRLDFDPVHGELPVVNGTSIRLEPPKYAGLPGAGIANTDGGFAPPAEDASEVTISVRPDSARVQLLEPFKPWSDAYRHDLPILLKAVGRCTTDHLSPAGWRWMRYRGHLDRLSDNLFTEVENAFSSRIGYGVDPIDRSERVLPEIARRCREASLRWIVVGDENYGEGSSREYPAMSARYFGCVAVIARSIARIHEANLKRHGVLPLTFVDPRDFDLVKNEDVVDIPTIGELSSSTLISVRIGSPSGDRVEIPCRHSLSGEELDWLRFGSALNAIRAGVG